MLEPWLEGGIHHIGATSVPGLAAKPFIDMMAGVRDFEEARAAYEPLLAAGWAHTPHRPGIAHHFSKADCGLHLTEPGVARAACYRLRGIRAETQLPHLARHLVALGHLRDDPGDHPAIRSNAVIDVGDDELQAELGG